MRQSLFKIAALLLSFGLLFSCEDEPKEVPNWQDFIKPGENEDQVQLSKKKIPSDMVLLYGGSQHRKPYKWSGTYLQDYMVGEDSEGNKDWLFDGFLLLEFMDVESSRGNKTFITDYKYNGVALPSALKSDWEALIDYYFEMDGGVNALEEAVHLASKEMGSLPPSKRKVVIGVPEPIAHAEYANSSSSTVYWGTLNGKQLDFSQTADRLAACKWYMEEIIKRFEKGEYKYLELAGFYWVAEKATQSRDLMKKLGDYLLEKELTFNWIPYYSADGFSEWKSFGFTCAYLQPNYFFNDSTPESRLDNACEQALKFNMGMEIEFDGNATASNGRGYKLRNYMSYFKKYGVWEKCPLAYYQGSWALKWLKNSSNEEDRALYHELCDFIINRPYRDIDE